MATGELLRCEQLAVGYGRHNVVAAGLDLRVSRGSYLGIVGPNGCGKTTLLKTIVGILRPVRGTFEWGGTAGSAGRRARIGYVPQRDSIDPIYPFRVLEVVLLALGTQSVFRPTPPREARERAIRALERVGLGKKVNAGYSELSGGQRQRALVARALALEPDCLALDEPTSELDPGSAERLLDLIDEMRREHDLTVVLVSHDLSLVARRASHALAMFEGRHVLGPVNTTLTADRLTQLYGYPMTVLAVDGRSVVVPGRSEHS